MVCIPITELPNLIWKLSGESIAEKRQSKGMNKKIDVYFDEAINEREYRIVIEAAEESIRHYVP